MTVVASQIEYVLTCWKNREPFKKPPNKVGRFGALRNIRINYEGRYLKLALEW